VRRLPARLPATGPAEACVRLVAGYVRATRVRACWCLKALASAWRARRRAAAFHRWLQVVSVHGRLVRACGGMFAATAVLLVAAEAETGPTEASDDQLNKQPLQRWQASKQAGGLGWSRSQEAMGGEGADEEEPRQVNQTPLVWSTPLSPTSHSAAAAVAVAASASASASASAAAVGVGWFRAPASVIHHGTQTIRLRPIAALAVEGRRRRCLAGSSYGGEVQDKEKEEEEVVVEEGLLLQSALVRVGLPTLVRVVSGLAAGLHADAAVVMVAAAPGAHVTDVVHWRPQQQCEREGDDVRGVAVGTSSSLVRALVGQVARSVYTVRMAHMGTNSSGDGGGDSGGGGGGGGGGGDGGAIGGGHDTFSMLDSSAVLERMVARALRRIETGNIGCDSSNVAIGVGGNEVGGRTGVGVGVGGSDPRPPPLARVLLAPVAITATDVVSAGAVFRGAWRALAKELPRCPSIREVCCGGGWWEGTAAERTRVGLADARMPFLCASLRCSVGGVGGACLRDVR
jgi:hypothetical protein